MKDESLGLKEKNCITYNKKFKPTMENKQKGMGDMGISIEKYAEDEKFILNTKNELGMKNNDR